MKYIIANWKMHGRMGFAKEWCEQFHQLLTSVPFSEKAASTAKVIIAPPAIYLTDLKNNLPEPLLMAAQDVSAFLHDGAHTGEVSANMLKDAGCDYVLVGHSERRAMGDNSKLLEKLQNALLAGIIPVFCVGEPLDVRERGDAFDYIEQQLAPLSQLDSSASLIIAYEPVWAIGTGKTASLEDIESMHQMIKDKYKTPVIYGGSVKPENAKQILASDLIDGALIGGASLKADEFLSIVEAAS